jgi:uridine phosphorylase
MRSREVSAMQWVSGQRSVVEPAAFARDMEAEDAVFSFSPQVFSRLVDAFGLGGAEDAPPLPGALGGKLDERIGVYHAFFGAPAAGMLMEALIASGVERFVMAGQAGAISPRCEIGDLFLPTWGVREEGTSYHYVGPEVVCHPSQDLLGVIRRWLDGVALVEGGVWTTDAPFRETPDKVEKLAKREVLAVEMECTALMAIARYRRAAFAAALVITDHVFGEAWVRDFRGAEVTAAQELLCGRLAEGFRRRGAFV